MRPTRTVVMTRERAAGIERRAAGGLAAVSVGDLEPGVPVHAGGRRAEREPQRPRRAPLLPDHVSQVVGVDSQLERRLVLMDAQDRHVDVFGMIDETLGHVRDEIAQLQIFGLGLATAGTGGESGTVVGDGAGCRVTGMDDSFSPARRKRMIHRPDNRSAGIA